MTLKRYDLGREYAGNTGSPAITQQPHGAYVRHDDHMALADEWRAEKNALEQIAMAQTVTITEARAEIALLDFIEKAWFYRDGTGAWAFSWNECWNAGQHESLRAAIIAAMQRERQP